MNKEYVEGLIKIGGLLLKNRDMNDKQGETICGAYWADVKIDLHKNTHVHLEPGGLSVYSPKLLEAYLQKCIDMLSEMIDKENDRQLDNESKLAAIKSNKIAKWAIVISVLAATGLPQYLLQWLCRQAFCIL